MRAKKCDRCGKLYEHYAGSKDFKEGEKANALFLIDRDLDNKYWSRKDYDLCPECMRKLERYIHGGTVPPADKVEVTFTHASQPGTVKIGDEVFEVYMGDYVEHNIVTSSGMCVKRKITLIEM